MLKMAVGATEEMDGEHAEVKGKGTMETWFVLGER
jgi:hypothetical protein